MLIKHLVIICFGCGLIFCAVGEIARYQERRFIKTAFNSVIIVTEEDKIFSADSLEARELACQRAWDMLNKLIASSTAFDAMRREFFSWEEIEISKEQAIRNHTRLLNVFYQDMLIVFQSGGPMSPWCDLSVFPKNMEQVVDIMALSCVPIYAPKKVPETKEQLPSGVLQL